MRNYVLYLKDIVDAMSAIEGFVDSLRFDDFKKDDKTSSAVIRKFEIIGEAARNVPAAVRKRYADIPWEKMTGMRNVLIHQYFGVNHDVVWKAIKNTIPPVKKQIERVLEELQSQGK